MRRNRKPRRFAPVLSADGVLDVRVLPSGLIPSPVPAAQLSPDAGIIIFVAPPPYGDPGLC